MRRSQQRQGLAFPITCDGVPENPAFRFLGGITTIPSLRGEFSDLRSFVDSRLDVSDLFLIPRLRDSVAPIIVPGASAVAFTFTEAECFAMHPTGDANNL